MSSDLQPVAVRRGGVPPALAIVAGAVVVAVISAYAFLHVPTLQALNVSGFSNGVSAKTWITTAAFLLALLQLGSASVMYTSTGMAGKLFSIVHVWTGRIAVLISLPVAVHCIYALGFANYDTRVLIHSLLGCLVYGVFTTKMLLLTHKGLPSWIIPLAGGFLFLTLAALWVTSAGWWISENGLKY